MSGKINVARIVISHLNTLRDHGKNRISLVDISVFLAVPLAGGASIFLFKLELSTGLANSLINASAILLGLLLNLLMLMFDQKNRTNEELKHIEANRAESGNHSDNEGKEGKLILRSKVISETASNISFATLLCIFSLCTLLLFFAFPEDTNNNLIKTIKNTIFSVNVFIWANVALTILMVIKRVFTLFIHDTRSATQAQS